MTDPFDIFNLNLCPRCREETCPTCHHCPTCAAEKRRIEQLERQDLERQLGEAQQILEQALGYAQPVRTPDVVATLARLLVARLGVLQQLIEDELDQPLDQTLIDAAIAQEEQER